MMSLFDDRQSLGLSAVPEEQV
jgi:hypothetical protein